MTRGCLGRPWLFGDLSSGFKASTGAGGKQDGTETKFDVVGADALSDLAVVRVQNSGAPAAPLGDADNNGGPSDGDGGI